ncbi:MAG: DUF4263 domain-containing protein [Anaerolineae bacterium]|nr:DUF4263 domain-containing protein [Anaerolineae bacterium]
MTTYWAEIRNFFASQPQYVQHIPQIFRWTYVFIGVECKDGYVVAAYPSGFADNFLFFEKNQNVGGVSRQLPNIIAGTEAHVTLSFDDFGGSGMVQAILDHVPTNGGPRPTTGWKFLYFATPDFEWSVANAKSDASQIIAELKARALLYEPQESRLLLRYDTVLWRQEIVSRLHQILARFRSIINEKSYSERVIHRFIRDHPILLFPTKKRLVYEHPLKDDGRTKYRMDFVVEVTTGRYILVELENPKHKLFTKAGEFRQIINHAENSQVANWILWIRRHLDDVEKDFPGIVAPEGLVVVGQNTGLTSDQRDQIRMWNEKHDIKLMTYDDLAEEAENHIKHLLDA